MKHFLVIFLITLYGLFPLFSQNLGSKNADSEYISSESKLVVRKVYSPGLENNLLGDSPLRSVSIYLPPGYDDEPGRRYPVIYFLHGFVQDHSSWWKVGMFADIDKIMDKLLNQGMLSPMIIVTPNSNNRYNGSLYTNSSVTGKWEDFIVKDIVNYVDRNFRTLPQENSRGIAGHSMGGYGTFRIVMRHPGIFSSAYGLSPAEMIFKDVLEKELGNFISALRAITFEDLDWRIQGPIAAAAAFAPNPNMRFHGELPVTDNGELIDSVWQKWLEHDPYTLLPLYKDNLGKLNAIQFDCGTEDVMLIDANIRFSEELISYEVDHIFETYPGDHVNNLDVRVETKLLPFFSRHLADSMLNDTVLYDLISWQQIEVNEHSDSVGTISLDTALYVRDSMSYSIIAGDPGNIFTMNSLTGEIVADTIKLDFETGDREHDLTIAAEYGFNETPIRDTANVFIEVINKPEHLLEVRDTIFKIEENSAKGTKVGRIPFKNPENWLLKFTFIEGNTNETFAVDLFDAGMIKVANSDSLDYENHPEFVLKVAVEELSGGICKDTISVIIKVDDIDETSINAPSFHHLQIYPNPTIDIITIETHQTQMGQLSIEITTMNGQLIYYKEMEGTTLQLNLSSFPKGVYFITIRSEDFVTTRKIIKM